MGATADVGPNKAIMKSKRKRGIYQVMTTRSKSWKSSRSLLTNGHYDMMSPSLATHVNTDAPPSVLPIKKYCDITGLTAKYTDPVTKIQFVSKEAFRRARDLPDHRHRVEEFLSLRQAQIRIK